VQYLSVPWHDCPDKKETRIIEFFQTVHTFLDQARRTEPLSKKRAALVHCRGGVSRSASIVASYLMRENGWGMDLTLQEMKTVRGVRPNEGFLSQLREYEQYLHTSSEEIMVGEGSHG